MPNFWRTDAACILKIQWFPLSILIFVQKSCFLGPTIFKIPQPSWFNAHGCIFIPLFSAKALHDELLELSGSEDRGLMFCVHNKIPIFSTDDMPYYNIKSFETLQEKRLKRRLSFENSYGNLILKTKTKDWSSHNLMFDMNFNLRRRVQKLCTNQFERYLCDMMDSNMGFQSSPISQTGNSQKTILEARQVILSSSKGRLNSWWIYEVIVSPKMPTKNFPDVCPTKKNKDRSTFFCDFLVSVGSFFWLLSLFVW